MEKNYEAAQAERQMQEFWEREKIYRFDREGAGRNLFHRHTAADRQRKSAHRAHFFLYAG